jgi:flagellar hook-length control protein FliK
MQSIAMDIMLQTQSAEKSSRPMEENTKNNTEKFDYILEKLVEESNELSVEKSGFKKQKHQSKIISENDIEGIEKDNSGSDKKSGTEISRVENKTVEFNLIYDKIYEFLLNMTEIDNTNDTLDEADLLNSIQGEGSKSVSNTEITISDIRSILNLLSVIRNKGSKDFRQKILNLPKEFAEKYETYTMKENNSLEYFISKAVDILSNENTVVSDITVKTPEVVNLKLKTLKYQAEKEGKKVKNDIATQKEISGIETDDTFTKENVRKIMPDNKVMMANAENERETANSDNKNITNKVDMNKGSEIKEVLNSLEDNTDDAPKQIKTLNTALFSGNDIRDNPKANVIDAVSKPETIRQPVTMAEKIISQVVSKAKVIVDGQKSEMVINLKPDSLGKLSMKVMTENKLVTAEIIAENYQVKQVIESGMQQLKQSLEEQGMFIQDLSVSVRQDGKKDTRNSMSNKKNDDGYPNEIEKQNGMSEYLNNPMDIPLKNPYILNESTINLTA